MSLEGLLGNDLYSDHGRLRTDDLAVRGRIADLLARASGALCAAAVEYQRLFVPQPTREQPFPPAEALEPARRAERVAAEVTSAAEAVRNAPFPDPQRVWNRIKVDGGAQLVGFDRALVAHAESVAAAVGVIAPGRPIDGEELKEFDSGPIKAAVRTILTVLSDRDGWLRGV